jgi:hypothetical protein
MPSLMRRAVRGGVKRLPTDYRKLSFDFLARRFTEGAELDVPHAHHFWRHPLNVEEKAGLLQRPEFASDTGDLFARAFDRDGVGNEFNRKIKDHGRSLWCVLTFVLWHRLFIQSNDYRQHLDYWRGEPPTTQDKEC